MVETTRNSLKPGYRLHWYEIKRVLGQGGFGITYLAWDPNLHQHVAIKEYFPVELSVREADASVHPVTENHRSKFIWGLERFVSEAQTLAQFKHPNIVRVLSVFEQNNVAYMVMEYEQGESLKDILKRHKTLDQPELLSILLPVIDGLEKVHNAGFIHRDIKPANIFIRVEGSPVLLDFGSARQSLGKEAKTLTKLVSPGYAPFEQYYSKGDLQGPWSDIYALAATMYRAISGVPPMDAIDRSKAIHKSNIDPFVSARDIGEGKYSDQFLHAIDIGLSFKEEERPQSIAEWKKDLHSLNFKDSKLASYVSSASILIDDMVGSTTQAPTSEAETVIAWVQDADLTPRRTVEFTTISAVVLAVALAAAAWIYREQLGIAAFIDRHLNGGNGLLATSENDPRPALSNAGIDGGASETNQIEHLLAQAAGYLEAMRLTSPNNANALARYREVLDIDPGNIQAILGIQAIGDKFIALARQAMIINSFSAAEDYLTQARNILGESENLKLARQELALNIARYRREQQEWAGNSGQKQDQRLREQIDALLEQGKADFEAQRLISPPQNNAFERFSAVLELQPSNEIARVGLKNVAHKLLDFAEQAMTEKKFDVAAEFLNQAINVLPNNDRNATVARKLEADRMAWDQTRTVEQEKQRQEQIVRALGMEIGQSFRDVLEGGIDGPELVVIAAGTFLMGDRSAEADRYERPPHEVKISEPFAMTRYEITFDDYDRFVAMTGSKSPGDEGSGRGRRPVVNVAWHEAQAYAEWLSKQTGKRYRLPSEAEWEYAARGGEVQARYWGEQTARACDYANVHDLTSKQENNYVWDHHECVDGFPKTAPTGQFAANSFGLHDMLGNVSEWTVDCWNKSYEGAPKDGSAWRDGSCAMRVHRGGSWASGPVDSRIPARAWVYPAYRNDKLGFRLVRDL